MYNSINVSILIARITRRIFGILPYCESQGMPLSLKYWKITLLLGNSKLGSYEKTNFKLKKATKYNINIAFSWSVYSLLMFTLLLAPSHIQIPSITRMTVSSYIFMCRGVRMRMGVDRLGDYFIGCRFLTSRQRLEANDCW